MQFPISQAMVHCDGKWELHEERRARYNSPSLPPLVEGISHNSRHTREGARAIYRKKKEALKSWVRVHGMMAIHCYISLFAPHATPTSHRNVPLLAKWEIAHLLDVKKNYLHQAEAFVKIDDTIENSLFSPTVTKVRIS